jgi:hypothetical protein
VGVGGGGGGGIENASVLCLPCSPGLAKPVSNSPVQGELKAALAGLLRPLPWPYLKPVGRPGSAVFNAFDVQKGA